MTKFIEALRSIHRGLRYDGPAVLLWRALTAALAPLALVELELLFRRDLRQPVPRLTARVPLVIREAEMHEIEEIARIASAESHLALEIFESEVIRWTPESERRTRKPGLLRHYLDRIARGEKCFVALVDNKIAHINWTCFKWGDVLPRHPIVLRPGEIYTTDAFTLPEYRGLNIHGAVLAHMLRHAQQLRCHRAYTASELARRRSYAIFSGLGWQLQGTALSVVARGAKKPFIFRLSGNIDPILRAPVTPGCSETLP